MAWSISERMFRRSHGRVGLGSSLLIALTITGCGSQQNETPTGTGAQRAPAATLDDSTSSPTFTHSGGTRRWWCANDEAIARVIAPWTGDLDGMAGRPYVRMLVPFSKTNYFLDGAVQYGISYDAGKLFETFLNDRLKTKQTPIHVVFIPVSRDRIFEELATGRGDIAVASLTITPDPQRTVDFAKPFLSNVREVVVTAADQPPVARAEDLSLN
jgi:ABC-type amino acid transport substrate-binding protein